MNWIAIQPLTGGMVIGAKEAIGCWPKAVISSGAFNDTHLFEYMKKHKAPTEIIMMDGDYKEFASPQDEEKFNKIKDVDIVLGVPVCSGLSMANSSCAGDKARGSCAVQNDNMYNIASLAFNRLKPKVFIFENAPTLYSKLGEGVAKKLELMSEKVDYAMTLVKTDTYLHGIPQHRKRTFGIFWKSKFAPIMEYQNIRPKKLAKYLEEIPEDATHQEAFTDKIFYNTIYNFAVEKYTKDKEDIRNDMVKEGINTLYKLIIKRGHLDELLTYSEKFEDEKLIKFIKHIKAKKAAGKGFWDNSNSFVSFDYVNAVMFKMMRVAMHPVHERFYNVREFIHLMGMPHDFDIINPTENFNHVAQNVPVKTAKFFIGQTVKFIKKELKFSRQRFIKQNNEKQTIDNYSKFGESKKLI